MKALTIPLAALLLLAGRGGALAQTNPPHPPTGNTGNYWYWVIAALVVVAIFWGAPRVFRMIRGQSPDRKP